MPRIDSPLNRSMDKAQQILRSALPEFLKNGNAIVIRRQHTVDRQVQ